MRLVKTYVVPESWENDTKGNLRAIYNTVMSDVLASSPLYNVVVAIFENNQASNTSYRGDFIVVYGTGDAITTSYNARNGRTNSTSGLSENRSFWASEGTVIKVYSAY